MIKLSERELEILKIIFIASPHFEKAVMTSENNRTPYQNEIVKLSDKFEKVD